MVKIRVLPDQVINQIAAGEVVDRPASVVRELVDNAVDAGATDIVITIEQGGQSLIKVVDNGFGMARDDALLAFERHATSKVRESSDLDAISTLGFRGEALASIAAIARVTLRTKTADAPSTVEVRFEGGVLKGVSDVSGNPGTTIEVRSIFFNTPARRKFLRSPKTEEGRIEQWLRSASIAHPEIRYRLVSDGAEILNIPRSRSLLDRGTSFFHGSTVPVKGEAGDYAVAGVVAHPSLAMADANSFVVLVNGRLVSDRMILKAVREGFDSTLKDREFPVGFLHIELPHSEVDVNVHPQKAEVRFRHTQAIFGLVREGVLAAVKQFKLPMAGATPAAFDAPLAAGDSQSWTPQPLVFGVREPQLHPEFYGRSTISVVGMVDRSVPPPEPFRFSDIRFIGQALECFLVGELNGKLIVVDMHAAHERYNYNLIRNRFRERNPSSQQLLIPETVELGAEGTRACLEEIETFKRFGFEIEEFGATALVVRALPSMVKVGAARQLIKEVAALSGEIPAAGRFEERLDHIAARIACHSSVRSGEDLNRTEAYALFEALDRTEFSAACPHGRPVIVSFTRDDVERWFGRDR